MGITNFAYSDAVANLDIDFDAHQKAVFPVFDKFITDMTSTKYKKLWLRNAAPSSLATAGIYIWGTVGRGKSFLMDMFFDIVPITSKKRIHFHDFMQDIHAQIYEMRQKNIQGAVIPVADRFAKNTKILCLDEMHITDITDAMLVGRLFERLSKKGVKIVTTSNFIPDKLYENGLNRKLFLPFIQIINNHFEVIEIKGDKDYRRAKIENYARYFYPTSPQNIAKVDKIWHDLCQDSTEHPLQIALNGRVLTLERFCNGAARIDFDRLCNHPLSAEDYLAISQYLRILIVDNIVPLSRENMNAARRFTTLIDIAYDTKMIMIFSADQSVEKLFEQDNAIFGRERTISRIYEMCAENWPATEAS